MTGWLGNTLGPMLPDMRSPRLTSPNLPTLPCPSLRLSLPDPVSFSYGRALLKDLHRFPATLVTAGCQLHSVVRVGVLACLQHSQGDVPPKVRG